MGLCMLSQEVGGPGPTPPQDVGRPFADRPHLAPDFQALSSHSTCRPVSSQPFPMQRASAHPEARPHGRPAALHSVLPMAAFVLLPKDCCCLAAKSCLTLRPHGL